MSSKGARLLLPLLLLLKLHNRLIDDPRINLNINVSHKPLRVKIYEQIPPQIVLQEPRLGGGKLVSQ